MHTHLPPDAEARRLGIVFLDLARFTRWAAGRDDREVAAMLQAFYALAAGHLADAGGRVVKVIGDAVLAVFEPERLPEVVASLDLLTSEFEQAARGQGFSTRVDGKVHVGGVLAGSFGPPGLERFDVLGRCVNEAALLRGEGIVLSPTAQALLA